MIIKKQYIFIGLVSVIVLFLIFLSLLKKNKEEQIIPVKIEENIKNNDVKAKQNNPIKTKEIITTLIPPEDIKVSLLVLSKEYKTEIKKESSVFEALQKIEKESTSDNIFSFKYRETIGLGNFITEINGVKGNPGKYWIYYVNDIKAPVGASQYILKEGDIISWKQEGI